MFRLKKLNVIKEVNSMPKAKKLISQGFALVSQPTFGNAVTTTPKPESSVSDERVKCPYCEKDYASEKGLKDHVKDKHPEQLKG